MRFTFIVYKLTFDWRRQNTVQKFANDVTCQLAKRNVPSLVTLPACSNEAQGEPFAALYGINVLFEMNCQVTRVDYREGGEKIASGKQKRCLTLFLALHDVLNKKDSCKNRSRGLLTINKILWPI